VGAMPRETGTAIAGGGGDVERGVDDDSCEDQVADRQQIGMSCRLLEHLAERR
jgi:hypothetical protein